MVDLEDIPVQFSPISDPQWAFLASECYEVLYGGAAFGGKSLCLMMDAIRQIDHPRYLATLFRRQYSELEELIGYAKEYYPSLGGVPREGGKDWTFSSGARILFRQMEHPDDWRKFMGRNTTYLGFDELVSFTKEQYESLQIWNRASAPGLNTYIRSTTNPWPDPRGDGIEWIMDRWHIPKYKPISDSIYTEEEVETDVGTFKVDKAFIPATHKDNPVGIENNPAYISHLTRLPDPYMRRAYLSGVWGVSPGNYFDSWNGRVHVLDHDEVLRKMKKDQVLTAGGMDYGVTSATVVEMAAQTLDTTVYIYDEYYQENKPIQFHAPRIKKMLRNSRIPVYCDPSMGSRGNKYLSYTDKTVLQHFKDYGLDLRLASNYSKRADAYAVIREAMYYDKELDKAPPPKLYISRRCKHLISDIEVAQRDTTNPNVVADDNDLHALAALRYLIMHIKTPYREAPKRDLSNTPAGVLSRLVNKKRINIFANT